MESDNVHSLPLIGEPAPAFKAVTTQGEKSLSDYKGSWVVFFSHPADFTPVCSTEFMAFARLQEEFKKRNVQLIGLSIDSVHAHLAWLQDLEFMSSIKIDFPVIADLDMKVSQTYGMIHPAASATSAVRAVFVIDTESILRAMIYYPLTTGRNMPEILRLVDALQFNQKTGMATPADWQPHQNAIVPAPATMEALRADQAKKDQYSEFKRWYLRLNKPI